MTGCKYQESKQPPTVKAVFNSSFADIDLGGIRRRIMTAFRNGYDAMLREQVSVDVGR